jgi:undecaprenyl diphosphate synthase
MGLFAEYLVKERETLLSQNIRMRSIGDRSRLPQEVLLKLETLEKDTAHCEGMDLVLAVSYGGRDEIVRAAKRFTQSVVEGHASIDDLNSNVFADYLDTSEIPDPDLLIRTSGEYRISNFLLWQLAYTEIIVTETLWPDFSREEFARCLHAYAKRERRYGKTSDDNRTQVPQCTHDIC